MNIGIISMQRVRNYGSFLQAYALKRMIEKLGHQVQFIDIERMEKHDNRTLAEKLMAKLKLIDHDFFKRLASKQQYKKIADMFQQMQKEYLGIEEAVICVNCCDAIVIGSDEIFNCDSNGLWKITPQRFGKVEGVPIVFSYAASCGYTDLSSADDSDRQIIQDGIRQLKFVSVRDENTAKVVKEARRDEPLRHLDPVLVYDFADEALIIDQCEIPSVPYMIVYSYHNRINSKKEIKAIRQYAKSHKLKMIAIGGSSPWCDSFPVLSPFQVLAYFKNAACIVTDTFHGTVMSIKYNKPFAIMVRDSNANKLNDLIDRVGIEAHAVSDTETLESILDTESDYSVVNRKLAEECKRSMLYFSQALKSE